MKRVLVAVLGLCVCGTSAFGATVLNVSVETSGGLSATTAEAGGVVEYQIVGELGAGVADNNGLALVGFDLELVGTPDPGPLPGADAPTSGSMTAFVKPDGITNPDGYGGTLIGNVQTQVGGGQNTINNVYACAIDSDCPGATNTCSVDGICSQSATFPVGAVETGIAWPGSPQVLVTGSLTIPAGAPNGTVYTLVLSNLFANVILAGEDGTGPHGFHKVVEAGVGSNTSLAITVDIVRILTWESKGPHGTIGEVGLAISQPNFSEPRLSGLSKLVVAYSGAINPATATNAAVSLVGNDSGGPLDLSGIAIATNPIAANTQLEIIFTPKLPDFAKYRVTLTGVESAGGVVIGGTTSVVVTALLGDADGNLMVLPNDVGGVSNLVAIIGIDPGNEIEVRSDGNNDGNILPSDVGGISNEVGKIATTILNP